MDTRHLVRRTICGVCLAAVVAGYAAGAHLQTDIVYEVESRGAHAERLSDRFSKEQLALLEKLNRADVAHLERLSQLVVPTLWTDELNYSVLPVHHAAAGPYPTYLVVYVPGQVFGAYEFGRLVRWGPVSTGTRSGQTPQGAFFLNWRSTGRVSTIDPDWFLRWYFNFDSREGLAFHEYALPGYPASHGCIRLLERDAIWLFDWGQGWTLDLEGARVLKHGTPVAIVGQYDFDAPPPWRSRSWLTHRVDLSSVERETLVWP
jgi:hypothetical protein